MTSKGALAIGSGAAAKLGNVTGNVTQFAHPDALPWGMLASDTLASNALDSATAQSTAQGCIDAFTTKPGNDSNTISSTATRRRLTVVL